MAVTFEIEGDHIALRLARAPGQATANGFGVIKSRRKGVPVDLDIETACMALTISAATVQQRSSARSPAPAWPRSAAAVYRQ